VGVFRRIRRGRKLPTREGGGTEKKGGKSGVEEYSGSRTHQINIEVEGGLESEGKKNPQGCGKGGGTKGTKESGHEPTV